MVITLAGSTAGYADATGAVAQFTLPWGLALDKRGNLFVADRGNFRIRRVSLSGIVTTLAGSTEGTQDGTGAGAQFVDPTDVTVDAAGYVYVVDRHRIRKVTPAGVVTTLAGSTQGYVDGNGAAAKFFNPSGIAVDAVGYVYVTEESGHRIRQITPEGTVSTVAGSVPGFADGTGTAAGFYNPVGLAVDATGTIYVADKNNHRIRKVR